MFDLRHLEHSTIIYEDPQHTPLLRLAWNKQDPNYLATVAMDACEVIILDVRVPCTPVARLNNHKACVNGIAWAPHSSCHICTAGKLLIQSLTKAIIFELFYYINGYFRVWLTSMNIHSKCRTYLLY